MVSISTTDYGMNAEGYSVHYKDLEYKFFDYETASKFISYLLKKEVSVCL